MSLGGEEIKLVGETQLSFSYSPTPVGSPTVSKLEKTDDSDTLPYFKKFLYTFDNPWNFQNILKETELPSPKETLDENNGGENVKREEFSAEYYPTDNTEDMMLKNGYSQPG